MTKPIIVLMDDQPLSQLLDRAIDDREISQAFFAAVHALHQVNDLPDRSDIVVGLATAMAKLIQESNKDEL